MSPATFPWPETARRLRVGDVCLDLRYRRVERDGECVELPRRMFELLLLFMAEPGVLHERGELFRRIWSGVVVEDGNLSQSVWMLRKALGEPRRHWLRTVARRGYVFEPPGPVEAIVEDPAAPVVTAMPRPTAVAETPAAPWPVTRRRLRWLAAAALLLAPVLLVLSLSPGRARKGPDSPLAVSLIVLADPAERTGAVPAHLLEAWLGWQLSMMPDVLLLSPAHLAADSGRQNSTVLVTLSAGPLDGDASLLYLQAAIQEGDVLRVEGPADDMVRLVDMLAARVRTALVPARAGQAWPVLQVTPGHAGRYLAMRQAHQARQWAQAAGLGEALLREAPQFGLGWFELAQVQDVLSRTQLAQASLDRARELLAPLPKDVAWLMDAQRLALGPDHEAAVAAYSELTDAYPHQPRFALELARARIRAGHYREALELLRPDVWRRQPASVRVSQLLVRGDAELALGDVAAARASAREADALAERAGWPYERGWATLLLARSYTLQQQGGAEMSLFNLAAGQFEQAGDELHALRARLLAASFSAADTALSEVELDALLASARDVGHPRMAVDTLRAVAWRHFRDGRVEAYRQRLAQAEALAREAGDLHAQAVFEIDHVNDDLMAGDLRGAGRRLDRLRGSGGMQGDAGQWLAYFDAYLAYREGRLEDALRHLEALGREQPLSSVPDDLADCLRAAVANRRAEEERARHLYGRCSGSATPVIALAAQVGLAQVDVHDRPDAARERVLSVLSRLHELDSVPERWQIELDAAGVLLRAGAGKQAAAIYSRLAQALDGTGFHLLQADVAIGLAEVAVLTGDWAAVGGHLDHARGLMEAQDWLLDSRAVLVHVVHAEATGEHNAAAGHLHRLDRQAHAVGDRRVLALGHHLFRALGVEGTCAALAGTEAGPDAAETPWLLSALPLRLAQAGGGS